MRIGLIGHQDLPKAVVRIVKNEIRRLLSDRNDVVAVTTLKPGAPQLMARLALEAGATIEVVVPCEKYEKSFTDGESLAGYRSLIGRARATHQLAFDQPSEEAYVAAGRSVVDEAEEVFAVWDGRPARRTSGTAELVSYADERGIPVTVLWLKKLFLSYSFRDSRLVSRVHYLLLKQPDVEPFFWVDERGPVLPWLGRLGVDLCNSGAMVVFAGKDPGDTQLREIQSALPRIPICLVCLTGSVERWAELIPGGGQAVFSTSTDLARRAREYARGIVQWLGFNWMPDDGIPLTYLFDYEKAIIEAYAGGQPIDEEWFAQGAPERWPAVPRKSPLERPNPISASLIGQPRRDAHVLVDARASVAAVGGTALTFLEAQPRETLYFPHGRLNVRVVVSGGVAPGTNAVIAEIARRHEMYRRASPHILTVEGYLEGFRGLLEGGRTVPLQGGEDREASHRGGSRLGTSRVSELIGTDPSDRQLLRDILGLLNNVDILYVIGGDGSMRAAHALATVAGEVGSNLSIIGIPKTTDNDILWVWQSFGHLSSVQRARDFLLELHTEVTGNPRLCVLQLFGSDSGFVVANAGLASAVANAVLVPEAQFVLARVSEYLRAELTAQRLKGQMPHGILLMAETAIPWDVETYLADDDVGLDPGERGAVEQFIRTDRRVRGQTPDRLRSAGMKIVTRVLERDIRSMEGYWQSFRVFGNEPRHLIRAMAPSANDVLFGQRLGANAVDAAMAGFHDCMVSHWLTEYVLVPLELVVLGRKRLPLEGAFWRAVLATTGQPDFQPDGGDDAPIPHGDAVRVPQR